MIKAKLFTEKKFAKLHFRGVKNIWKRCLRVIYQNSTLFLWVDDVLYFFYFFNLCFLFISNFSPVNIDYVIKK